MGFFDKLKKINVFTDYTALTDDFYEELEDRLILSDMGTRPAAQAVERLRAHCEAKQIGDMETAKSVLRGILAEMLNVGDSRLILYSQPSIVLFIGVNGVGKTTTIGKVGHILQKEGKKVLFAAGDTFRAAAAEQLTIWANRCGVEIVKQGEGADPAAVVFDAINAANARLTDVVLVDTAGRLHNKSNLMKELNKIDRVIRRELPICSKECLLVLDATTGQNGLNQARQFKDSCGITGIVLTKLDGTAKGGIAIAIAQELGLPVKFAGVGEGIDDLRYFDADEFVRAFI